MISIQVYRIAIGSFLVEQICHLRVNLTAVVLQACEKNVLFGIN